MIRISVIVNDEAAPSFKPEHGLAIWVEVTRADGSSFRLLADSGQHPKTLLANAQRLGIDLASADAVVLSHGHYDHAGGLPALASVGYSGPVVASPHCVRRRFSVSLSRNVVDGVAAPAVRKENGLPCPDVFGAMRHVWVDAPTEVLPGLTVFPLPGDAPANVRLIDIDGRPDTFPDELFALVSDGQHSLLLGGCTHHGLGQLLPFVRDSLGVTHLDAFVGGLHLVGHPEAEISDALSVAQSLPVSLWVVGHCTGEAASAVWAHQFPGSRVMRAGDSFRVGE